MEAGSLFSETPNFKKRRARISHGLIFPLKTIRYFYMFIFTPIALATGMTGTVFYRIS
jgi:hypothetical protein